MGVSICLCMICGDNEPVLVQALESFKPVIDYWVINHNGKNSAIRDLIVKTLDGVPGEFVDGGWVNFSHNRNLVLDRARDKADYFFLPDADEVAVVSPFFDKNLLTAPAYFIKFTGSLDWCLPLLVSSKHSWKYHGVCHEYIAAEGVQLNYPVLPTLMVTHIQTDGDGSKIKRNLDLLLQGVTDESDNSRYLYYLGQTYRDAGDYDKAIEFYGKRVMAAGWDQEQWHAAFQIGVLQSKTGNWVSAVNSLLTAYSMRPARAEPLYYLANYYRQKQAYHLAYWFSVMGLSIPYPSDVLFVERDIYAYLLQSEYAIAASYLHRHNEAIAANRHVLNCPVASQEWKDAAKTNLELSLKALAA